MKELLLGNNLTDTNIQDEKIADMLKVFDRNGDQIITKEEFVTGLTEYINQSKHALDQKYLPKESMNKMYQVCDNAPCDIIICNFLIQSTAI